MKNNRIVLTVLTWCVTLSWTTNYYHYTNYIYPSQNFPSYQQHQPRQNMDSSNMLIQATPMNIAVQYADSIKMKNILLEAPIQKVLCTFEPEALYNLLNYLPNFSTGNDSPKQVKKTICEDKKFYEKMKSIHPDTFKQIINALPDINSLFAELDESFSARIIQSANSIARANSHGSFLDNYNVVYRLYQDMPNVGSHLASALLDVNCGYIVFVMENHQNLEYLIPYMDSKTLNHVIECYPQIGEKMATFDKIILERVLRNVFHLIPFLGRLKSSTKDIYLLKVPQLGRLMPKSMKNDTIGLKIVRMGISKKNAAYLRSKVPKVDMILNRLSDFSQAALNSKMPNITRAVETMSSEDLERINSQMEGICDALDKNGRTYLIKVLQLDKEDPVSVFFSLLL